LTTARQAARGGSRPVAVIHQTSERYWLKTIENFFDHKDESVMKQLIRTAVMGIIAGLLLGGCTTINVTDATWSHPGSAAMAPKALHELSATTGYSVRYASFHGSDGTLLYGLLLTRPGNKITILNFDSAVFQTGTGGLETGRMFESVGVNAFLVDYRGYGMSEGGGTQMSLAVSESDALAAYDFLRTEPSVRGSAIVVEGLSLGSFFAPYVANHRPVSGLVLESTATNASDWIHDQVPWFAVPFVRIHIAPSVSSVSNISELQRYHCPLLLLVGSKDEITPPQFARELYQKSATPTPMRVLYVANGERHGTVLLDNAAARKKYVKFLKGIVEGKF
jgi:fermentation-respiration switch protein FrsA (DUF1100 family)